jgi:hypothetical protein
MYHTLSPVNDELYNDVLSELKQLNQGVKVLVWINVASIIWLCFDEYRSNTKKSKRGSKDTKPS